MSNNKKKPINLKGHWKTNFNYKYLGSHDIPELVQNGKDLIVVIKEFYTETVKNERTEDDCIIAEFTNPAIKPMIINKTNFKNLSVAFGSTSALDFIGKSVAIYIKPNVWNGSEKADALRIRDILPVVEIPNLVESEIQSAVNFYSKYGNLVKFKEKRTISEEQEKRIIELSESQKSEQDAQN